MQRTGVEHSPLYSLDDVKKLKADLAQASLEELTANSTEDGSLSLLVGLFGPLFGLYQSTENFQLKVAACDALATWLNQACKILDVSNLLLKEIAAEVDLETRNVLYRSMLCDWDIGVPIHAPLRNVFAKTLALHTKISSGYDVELRLMVKEILKLDYSQKSVYYSLELVRKVTGICIIPECDPDFFSERLSFMQDASIATPLGRLLSGLLLESLPKPASEKEQLTWMDSWQSTMKQTLLTANASLITNIMTYLLPEILKPSETIFYGFTESLAASSVPASTDQIYLVLQCVRIAKDVNVIQDVSPNTLMRLGLSKNILYDLLLRKDQLLRTTALKVVVSHPKTSTPFPLATYELLRATLSYSFCENDMHYRKEIMDSMRSFLLRFQGSLYNTRPLLRKARAKHDSVRVTELLNYIEMSESFAQWLVNFLKVNLQPGSGYQATYMSLQTIQLMSGLGWSLSYPAVCEKFAAFRVTTSSNKDIGIVLPFVINLYDKTMNRLLLDHLGDSFDDNRTLALSILRSVPRPMAGLSGPDEVKLLYETAQRLLRSTRGRDGDGGARVIQFLYQKFVCTQDTTGFVLTNSNHAHVSSIGFIEDILDDINTDVQVASVNLLQASQKHPIHGKLNALQYIFESTDYSSVTTEAATSQAWKELHSRVLLLSHRTWDVVRQVLCDDSPEGSLPSGIPLLQSTSLRGSETQEILSFCWRALRQVSTLLRTILTTVPYGIEKRLIDQEDFTVAGDLFLTWLTEVRHRGAFSAVFVDFVDVCKRLRRMSKHDPVRNLPQLWLEINIQQLRASSHRKDITRRSGGLPMSIISLLIAEIEINSDSRTMIDYAFKQLLELVNTPLEAHNDEHSPQVHALNTLKDIFLESKLASCSVDYIETCFIISIDGFSSRFWAIRNCSLMLFSSLLRRSFGSKLPRSESMTRTYSARSFFGRYPRVLVRVSEELKTAVAKLFGENLQSVSSGLHPCLTLLTRLDFADAEEEAEEYENFAQLLNLLTIISTSRIWQVRSMAAQAVPTFVEPELVASFIIQHLNQATTNDQNALHGRLLMIYHVLQYNLDTHSQDMDYVEQVLDDVRRAITSKLAAFTSDNRCPVTETVWLRILLFLARTSRADRNLILRQRVVDYCARRLTDKSATRESTGSAELLEIMTTICLRFLANPTAVGLQPLPAITVLKSLLEDERAPVRSQVYRLLVDLFQNSAIFKSAALRRAIESQSAAELWPVTRMAARRCLCRLPIAADARSPETARKLVDNYIADVESNPDDSSDVACTLIIIGQLIGQTSLMEPRFNVLLTRLGGDNIPFETRKAVLQSLNASGVLSRITGTRATEHTDLVENALKYIPIVWTLLADDEEDIRSDTALYINDRVLVTAHNTPERTKDDLIHYLVTAFPNSTSLQAELIKHLGLESDIEAALSKALHPSASLFAVEKQNLWRNPVNDAASALRGLSMMNLTTESLSKLAGLSEAGLRAILLQFKTRQVDGPLGWTSIPDVWQLVVRVLNLSNWLITSSKPPGDVKLATRTLLKSCLAESSGLHIHPYLLDFMHGDERMNEDE